MSVGGVCLYATLSYAVVYSCYDLPLVNCCRTALYRAIETFDSLPDEIRSWDSLFGRFDGFD